MDVTFGPSGMVLLGLFIPTAVESVRSHKDKIVVKYRCETFYTQKPAVTIMTAFGSEGEGKLSSTERDVLTVLAPALMVFFAKGAGPPIPVPSDVMRAMQHSDVSDVIIEGRRARQALGMHSPSFNCIGMMTGGTLEEWVHLRTKAVGLAVDAQAIIDAATGKLRDLASQFNHEMSVISTVVDGLCKDIAKMVGTEGYRHFEPCTWEHDVVT